MLSQFMDNQMLTFRIILAGCLAGGLVILICPFWVRFLQARNIVDHAKFDHEGLDGLMRSKVGTPTMGGCLLSVVVFLVVLLFSDLNNPLIRLILFSMLWLGALGAVDDILKLRTPGRDGLHAWEKAIFQLALPAVLAVFLFRHTDQEGSLWWFALKLTGLIFVTSNGVNLTDGKDGLAAGCLLIVWVFLLLSSWVAGVADWANVFGQGFVPNAAELTILSAAVIGACVGFLWHNFRPATLFMGDSGSLPLGGMIGVMAVMLKQERFLLILGGIFWVEILSVLLQVAYSKLTQKPGESRGKYLFRCAPIHHHFMLGIRESLKRMMESRTLPRNLQGPVELFRARETTSSSPPQHQSDLDERDADLLLVELTSQFEGKVQVGRFVFDQLRVRR